MIGAILPIISNVLERVIPDKNARAAAQEKLKSSAQAGELDLLVGQLAVNKIEAAHKSLFVAGWRPAIGWVCGFGLLYNVILHPFAMLFIAVFFPDLKLELVPVDPALLYPVLLGMLGLGTMRTVEKANGVAREK